MTGDLTISKGSGTTKIPLICPNDALAGLYMAESYTSETNYLGGSIRYDSGANQLIIGTGNASPADALWIQRGSTDVNFNGGVNIVGNLTVNDTIDYDRRRNPFHPTLTLNYCEDRTTNTSNMSENNWYVFAQTHINRGESFGADFNMSINENGDHLYLDFSVSYQYGSDYILNVKTNGNYGNSRFNIQAIKFKRFGNSIYDQVKLLVQVGGDVTDGILSSGKFNVSMRNNYGNGGLYLVSLTADTTSDDFLTYTHSISNIVSMVAHDDEIIFSLNENGNTTIQGDLTVDASKEIYYKGYTLDNRFHPTSTTFVDISTNQTIGGEKTFSNNMTINANLDVSGISCGAIVSQGNMFALGDLSVSGTINAPLINANTTLTAAELTCNGDLDVGGKLYIGENPVVPIRDWEMDLSIQNSGYYYPVVFETDSTLNNHDGRFPTVEFEIFGQTLAAVNSHNEQTIKGYVRAGGWTDHSPFYEFTSENFDADEWRISQIWRGSTSSYSFAVYVRGGYKYTVRTNADNVIQPWINPTPGEPDLVFTYVISGASTYSLKNIAGTDASPSGTPTPSVNITLVSGVERDTKIIGSKTIMKDDLDVDGDLVVSGNLGGDVVALNTMTSKNFVTHGGYPLISQVHSFIQPSLSTFNQSSWFLHSPHYDSNNTNAVFGVKSPVPIVPYAISVSTDATGDSLTDFTFQVRARNDTANIANLDTTTTYNVGEAVINDIEENDAGLAYFTGVAPILPGYSWGLYCSAMNPNGYDGEIVVKVYFFQGGLSIA